MIRPGRAASENGYMDLGAATDMFPSNCENKLNHNLHSVAVWPLRFITHWCFMASSSDSKDCSYYREVSHTHLNTCSRHTHWCVSSQCSCPVPVPVHCLCVSLLIFVTGSHGIRPPCSQSPGISWPVVVSMMQLRNLSPRAKCIVVFRIRAHKIWRRFLRGRTRRLGPWIWLTVCLWEDILISVCVCVRVCVCVCVCVRERQLTSSSFSSSSPQIPLCCFCSARRSSRRHTRNTTVYKY